MRRSRKWVAAEKRGPRALSATLYAITVNAHPTGRRDTRRILSRTVVGAESSTVFTIAVANFFCRRRRRRREMAFWILSFCRVRHAIITIIIVIIIIIIIVYNTI